MESLCWRFRPRHRHEYFRSISAAEGAAKEVWIRAGSYCCGSKATDRQMSRSMYQISTSSALVEGIHSGSVPSSTLLEHGDFGLGTFEALAGEMVVLDGLIYQIAGEVRLRSDDFLVPFAAVARFHEDFSGCGIDRRYRRDT